jgi:MFS transporter, ACS family, tartrate transporter
MKAYAVASSPTTEAFERDTLARVSRRCIPLLLLGYIIAFIDRVNIGFAAITASKDLGMSPTDFGVGASVFFVAYLLFEVPSNFVLERVGARKWLARIMVTCGIVAGAMIFVKGVWTFYVVRFMLGAVEAGLFPGVMLYLTYWFPQRYRARYVGMFAIGIPMASVIGSPISGLILNLDGLLGFKGWQWLYVLEAIPAVIVGMLILFFLTDRPADAHWLRPDQREWLEKTIAMERAAHPEKAHRMGLLESLKLLVDRRVVILSLVFFGTGMPSYGLSFWLPQIVHDFGLGNTATGFLSAVPFACGCIAMIYWARHSDRSQDRVWHTAIAAFVAAVGMVACFFLSSPVLTMVALSVSAVGAFGIKGPFLSSISESFSPETAAVGIAMVVSIGNLSGGAAPLLVGMVKNAIGTYPPSLVALGICSLIGGLLIFLRPAPERSRQ